MKDSEEVAQFLMEGSLKVLSGFSVAVEDLFYSLTSGVCQELHTR